MRRKGMSWLTVVLALAVIGLAILLWLCRHPKTIITQLEHDHNFDAARTAVFKQIFAVSQQLSALPWYVYEYHDEQKLIVGDHYGPMVHAFASPYLGSFTEVAQYNTHQQQGILVAIVAVDAPSGQTLEDPYTKLHLTPGVNCVHLAHSGNDAMQGWRAFVTPIDNNGVEPCPHDHDMSNPLQVNATRPLATPATPASFFDYPAATRLSEDASGQPVIGIKCLTAWCEIGPPGFVAAQPFHLAVMATMKWDDALAGTNASLPIVDDGVHPRKVIVTGWREGQIKGWHDEQRIAMIGADGKPKPSNIRASLTPVPGLQALTDADYSAPRHVVTIWLDHDPDTSSDFAIKWKFKAGANRLFAQKKADGTWTGYVIPSGTTTQVTIKIVQRKHFDVAIPGTARWRWSLTDELIWWDCGGGACCEAEAS